ncbi:MAG: DUF1579 domain-containing protein [Pirellulales bacterium]|nr:DUF1579 domain-containing protein [Pirellulales bacterium]
MKRPLCYVVVATLGAAILSSTVLVSSAAAQSPEEILRRDEGTWKAELKFVMPDGSESVMNGTETNRMLGDWVISDFVGEVEGQQFSGHAVYGFDQEKEKFVATWVDSMPQEGTPRRLALMLGEYDKESDTLTMHTEGYNMEGEKAKEKHVHSYDGSDKRTVTFHQQGRDGEWAVMMVVSYTRIQQAGSGRTTADK